MGNRTRARPARSSYETLRFGIFLACLAWGVRGRGASAPAARAGRAGARCGAQCGESPTPGGVWDPSLSPLRYVTLVIKRMIPPLFFHVDQESGLSLSVRSESKSLRSCLSHRTFSALAKRDLFGSHQKGPFRLSPKARDRKPHVPWGVREPPLPSPYSSPYRTAHCSDWTQRIGPARAPRLWSHSGRVTLEPLLPPLQNHPTAPLPPPPVLPNAFPYRTTVGGR